MQQVQSILGQGNGYPVRCSFFIPCAEGEIPKPVSIDMNRAQVSCYMIANNLAKARSKEVQKYTPFSNELLSPLLHGLSDTFAIRPCGNIVISDKLPEHETSAGTVWPIMRIAFIQNEESDSINETVVHELAHLAGISTVDNMAVLLDPETYVPCSTRMTNTAWKRVVRAPVTLRDGKWDFDDQRFVTGGLYFEEAMAELISLRFSLGIHAYREPVVFKGESLVFELPREYRHNITAWGILMLERKCPGLVEILIDGARGNVNYLQLKALLDSKFSSLFDKLFDVRAKDGLAKGTEIILKTLAD